MTPSDNKLGGWFDWLGKGKTPPIVAGAPKPPSMLGRALGPAGAVVSAIDAPNVPGRMVNDLSTTAQVDPNKPGALMGDMMHDYTRPLRGALSAERHIAGMLPMGLSQGVSWLSAPVHAGVERMPQFAQQGIQSLDTIGKAVGAGDIGSNLESVPRGVLRGANGLVQGARKSPYGTWNRYFGEMGDSLMKDWIAPNSWRQLQKPKSGSPASAPAMATAPQTVLPQANQVTAGTTGVASQRTPAPPGGAGMPRPPAPGGLGASKPPAGNFLSAERLNQYIGSKPTLSLPETAKIPQFGS